MNVSVLNHKILNKREQVKRTGSHMPPMHLRHGRRYCLVYCSDIRTEESGNIGNPSLYRRHTCEVDPSGSWVVGRGRGSWVVGVGKFRG